MGREAHQDFWIHFTPPWIDSISSQATNRPRVSTLFQPNLNQKGQTSNYQRASLELNRSACMIADIDEDPNVAKCNATFLRCLTNHINFLIV